MPRCPIPTRQIGQHSIHSAEPPLKSGWQTGRFSYHYSRETGCEDSPSTIGGDEGMSALLQEVLVDQLRDLLHAEGQLVKALPRMARAAKTPELKTAFQNHTEETKGQVERLKQVFELLGE